MSLQTRLATLITQIGADVKAATTPYTVKQQYKAGILADTAPGNDNVNGVFAHILAKPTDANPNANAFVVKRPSFTGGWADSTPYGAAQAFLVLSSSSQAANDLTGDGVQGSNNNPVLGRLDAFGGAGFGNGIHVAPGLRKTGAALPTQGIWIDTSIDSSGLIIDNANTSELATTPTMAYLACRDTRQAGTPALMQVDAAGVLKLRAQGTGAGALLAAFYTNANSARAAISTSGISSFADNGTASVASLFAADTPTAGYRALFLAQTAGTKGLGILLAASQTADAIEVQTSGALLPFRVLSDGQLRMTAPVSGDQFLAKFLNSSDVLRAAIKTNLGFLTYADDGSTAAAAIYPADAGTSGARAIFNSIGTGTMAFATTSPASMTVDLWQCLLGGSVQWRINKTGYALTMKTAAPTAADIPNSSLTYWWDATNFRVTFYGKTSGGVAKTGTVQLA